RSEQAWLASLETHALKIHPWRHGRKLAYGYRYPQRHARAHIDFYRRHNDAVRAYFKDRPDDFVELCWERGDGYRELCALLGRPAPDAPTPRANSAAAMPTRRTYYLANRFLSLFG
ncbi:MAG: sulfotransferase, partial [Gammaproteobacteria bacterium]